MSLKKREVSYVKLNKVGRRLGTACRRDFSRASTLQQRLMDLYGELEWRGMVYAATEGLRDVLAREKQGKA